MIYDNQKTEFSVVEKILERLEEVRMKYFLTIDNGGSAMLDFAYEQVGEAIDQCKEIVQEVADENNGWIPCSDTQKCPNVSKWCARYFWVTLRRTSSKILFTEKLRWIGYMNRWEWCNGRELSNDYEVIAWREYFSPEPYKQKGE